MAQTQMDLRRASGEQLDVTVRDGVPEDAARLAGMLRGLSPESAFRRFLSGLGEPKPGVVRALLATDARRGARLAVLPDGHVIGHACWSVDSSDVADVGVIVTDAWQRRGLGRLLVRSSVGRAAAAGATTLHLDVHPENRPVVRLLRERLPGAAVRFADGLVQFDAPIPATPRPRGSLRS